MRFNKTRVNQLAKTVVERLEKRGFLRLSGGPESVVKRLAEAITEELEVENRLNADVRNMLKQFEKEFEEGRADYQKMFTMVKQKLIKERGIVL